MSDERPSYDLQKLQALDQGEWARLQSDYFHRIYFYVKRQINDPDAAEDVTSETFLGALKGIERFDERYNVEQFLFGIARKKIPASHIGPDGSILVRLPREVFEHDMERHAKQRAVLLNVNVPSRGM